jgi:steroid 5-alpha reductase family enzyme
MLYLYKDPWHTFRFADDRIVPRFHLEGILPGSTSKEEKNLIERFGDDYGQYMAATGRFWPRLLRQKSK